MAKEKKGWISLHRKIQDSWVWEEKPFNKGQAWIDILLMVNHEPNKFLHGNELIEIEEGQTITSISKLSDRWGWSRHKVSNFLNLLESDQMIVQNRDSKRTNLKVLNYGLYQGNKQGEQISKGHQKDNEGTSKGHQKDNEGTSKGHQKDTNNNVNNYNNYNNENNENNENKNIQPGAETAHEPKGAKGQCDLGNVVITLALNDNTSYDVYEKQTREWQELYSAADVIQELRKMKGWIDANPKKRKTRGGILRFITNWLSREQDKGGIYRNQPKTATSGTNNQFLAMLAEMED